MKKKKILISLSYYLPNISGLTVYANNLAQELKKEGFEVQILTSQYNKKLLQNEWVDGLFIKRIPMTFKISKGPLMMRLPFQSLMLIKDVDVVNCHLPQFESAIIAIISKLLRKKLVLTYHANLSWSGGIVYKIAKCSVFISEIIAAFCANTIVVNSKDYAQHSRFLRFYSKKLVFIYPPVTVSLKKLQLESLKLTNGYKKKHIIGFAGRLVKEKGIEYIIRSIPILQRQIGDNFLLVLIGPKNPIGEESYYHNILVQLKKYRRNVKFLGNIKTQHLSEYYKSLDVLLLPSINSTESFGMVQIEAMMEGTPVIASDIPGVRVPVTLTKMGELVTPQDEIDLARKVLMVIRNKQKYRKSREEIMTMFSLKKTVSEYIRIFST